MDRDCLLHENLSIKNNSIYFKNLDIKNIADEYKTPLYIYDDDFIRKKISEYKKGIKDGFDGNAKILYASKAFSCKYIYSVMKEENIGIDVVSKGEIWTAAKAGFNLKNSYFHSNNKTDDDIIFGIENGVGVFVIDNEEELYALDKIAKEKNIKQDIMIRVTPGIDPHTYEKIATGHVDSKFGFPIKTGQADLIVKKALELENVNLKGFHAHVGSLVFDSKVFIDTAEVMMNFVKYIYDKYKFFAEELNLGGGYGVRYVKDDPVISIYDNLLEVGKFIKDKVKVLGIKMPTIVLEPGRSIVADSCITVYKVGNVKKIPNYKNYVSVDGGMGDNIRYALYNADYTFLPIENVDRNFDMKCDIVGRFCESGDELKRDAYMPSDIKRGDLLVCLTTGAYQYAMASNYNRVERPLVIGIKGDKIFTILERESLSDITKLDR